MWIEIFFQTVALGFGAFFIITAIRAVVPERWARAKPFSCDLCMSFDVVGIGGAVSMLLLREKGYALLPSISGVALLLLSNYGPAKLPELPKEEEEKGGLQSPLCAGSGLKPRSLTPEEEKECGANTLHEKFGMDLRACIHCRFMVAYRNGLDDSFVMPPHKAHSKVQVLFLPKDAPEIAECPHCKGTGREPACGGEMCAECSGTGEA